MPFRRANLPQTSGSYFFMFTTLAILVAIGAYLVFIYNGLVKSRQMAEEAWSGIDVQLKRRADLIQT